MKFNHRDKYFKQAKKDGFRARSVYKLQEIDTKMRLIRPGQTILDIGSAPGSWAQYLSRKVGDEGRVVAIDLKEVDDIGGNVVRLQGDITTEESLNALKEWAPYDGLTSDLAPKTSGIKHQDQWLSVELSLAALDLCKKLIKPGGFFIAKVFQGGDFHHFMKDAKKILKKVTIITPDAVRKSSREVYVVGRKK